VITPWVFLVIAILDLSAPPAESEHRTASRPPIRGHDSAHEKNITTIVERDTAVSFTEISASSPFDTVTELNDSGAYFDNGKIDVIAVRTALFDAWRMTHQEEWSRMDSTIRGCAQMRYVNASGRSVEESIDECLKYYETFISYGEFADFE
jgi:hypothetical protein